jgi:hypothetical protein
MCPFAPHPLKTAAPVEVTSASVRLSASESADGPLTGALHRMCRLSSQLTQRSPVDAHPLIRSRSIRCQRICIEFTNLAAGNIRGFDDYSLTPLIRSRRIR